MIHTSKKKTISLLALLPPAALAGKENSYTKTFKFKEDFFLRFHPLPTAIGPNESVDVLMDALDGTAERFKDVWIDAIESTLLGGGKCTVNRGRMRLPEFSICDWKYPDRYDVDELPTPGQCYDYESGFIQRIYYDIKKLEITCPEGFDYDDLDKDAYTQAVFEGQDLLEAVSPRDANCDGDNETVCLFSGARAAEWSSFNECTAELYINRFVDVPVYLKCLDADGYGRGVANKLIEALDRYFELVVSVVLEEKIADQAPTGFVYNFASPYASDRKYGAHGAYYAGGNLVDQVPDEDGIMVTKFTYGFDVIWYKPKSLDEDFELLPDLDYTINEAFDGGDFLRFLRDEYPDYDFIQDVEFCDAIDPGQVTFPPTEKPTPFPTEGPDCDLYSNDGCGSDQVCRLSCVLGNSEPKCYDDDTERDCSDTYGPGYVCSDSNGDGIIDGSDDSNGCQFKSPTASPVTKSPTGSPSKSPTLSPVIPIVITSSPTKMTTLYPTPVSTLGSTEAASMLKTLSPTPLQVIPAATYSPTKSPVDGYSPTTPSPTCPFCIVYPDDKDEDECPIVTTGKCGGGERGDGICAFDGYCCSKWGWCGTTSEYCDDEDVAPSPSDVPGAPPAPTYSVDAGQCASGDVGDGFCPDESLCCSDWGYCGSGESYCFTTRIHSEDTEEGHDGTCGGGGIGDGNCASGLCCSRFGFCGEGDLYCTGQYGLPDDVADDADEVIKGSPLPDNLKPEFGFRCGVTEVDARSNCKPECTHHIQCSDGEECWGVQLNYCNTFEEGDHPICTNLDLADDDSRCGYDEMSARGHCGPKCNDDADCVVEGQYCFPTLLNLCDCHEQTCPEQAAIAFSKAQALIGPYFVKSEVDSNSKEGKPRNASEKTNLSVIATLILGSFITFIIV